MRSRASRRRLSDNDIRCSASDRRWFPARPAQHVHRRRNNGKGRIQSALASAHGRNGKDASRHATPDAPERIDHRRRCTRHDHRTCCRGSRGSASLPCHTLRRRVEMCHAGSRGSASWSASLRFATASVNQIGKPQASSPRCMGIPAIEHFEQDRGRALRTGPWLAKAGSFAYVCELNSPCWR